jgi:oligopeptidase B
MQSLLMKRLSLVLLILAALGMTVSLACSGGEAAAPPDAKKVPKVDTLHGEVITDNYFWLREKENPEVIAYIEAENAYVEEVTSHSEKFQEDLYEEILGRIKETDMQVPYKLNDYFYYSRTEEGKDYQIYCRKKGSLDAEEEIYLDQNVLAEGREYLGLGALEVSPDQKLLAYSIDTTGGEKYALFVKNIATGELFGDIIMDVSSVEWANDNQTIFYTVREKVSNRPYKLFRHKLGTSQTDDILVYHEEDDMFWMGLGKTKSKKFLIMQMGSHSTTETHILDANTPAGKFKLVAPRRDGIEYDMSHRGDEFFILTNDNAQNFKMMKAPASDPSLKNWKEFIGHRENVTLEGMDLFSTHLVIYERENGLNNLNLYNLETGETHYVDFPEPVYSVSGSANPEFNSQLLRFTYRSLVTPRSVYDYNMDTRDRELKKQQEVIGGYDASLYQSERVFIDGHDGAKIPVSIVYKKDMFKRDGSNPMYMYVYGAYGHSMDPYFSSVRLSILNRGFVFCLAHVRGGSVMGRKWYDDGKLLKKMNTFKDVISCSEYMIKEKYTSSDNLVLSGGSAGGTTVGAAMNMRPDLFGIVVAAVPFVDVVNTLLDPDIPLTVIEWDELGNPHEKMYYDYLKAYSPYENVEAKDYPTILITTSLNDPRVAYWEPAKWTARLRDLKTDDNLLLLKTNMGAGHGGASGRYEAIKDLAFEYVFILEHFGINK